MNDDPTPVIYWIQPDGSCICEWPDGGVMTFNKDEWETWRHTLMRGEPVVAFGWGDDPEMKVIKK